MHVKRPTSVAIIGAGVAGLSTARMLLQEGIDCTLFERGRRLGGVWTTGYSNFGAQVQKELYEFPDYPLPEGTADFTPGPVIQQYLEGYAKHFDIWPRIRFETSVLEMRRPESGREGWIVVTESNGKRSEESFDVVVPAIGLYSNRPHTPHFPGQDSFQGEVMHVSQFQSRDSVAGKKVVVVGYGKSATDVAVEASAVAEDTTIVFREAHWPVPAKLLGVLPFKWAMLSRLTSALIPAYYRPSVAERVLHTLGRPAVWFWWRLVELLLKAQCRLGSRFGTRVSLVPSQPVEIDTFGEAAMLPRPEFYRLVRNGGIRPERTKLDRYDRTGVVLENGARLDADVVILATGWQTDYAFLPTAIRESLGFADDGFYLYRQMLHPSVPDLYFIGAASTISNILTHSLQARWLGELLSGRMSLPDADVMLEDIDQVKAWKRRWMPRSSARSARLLLHMLHYHDQILMDFGADPRRKQGMLAPFKEVFAPYQPSDYAEIVSGDWRRKAA